MAQKAEQETVKYLTPLIASHTWAHLPLVTSLLSTYHIKTAESPGVGGGGGVVIFSWPQVLWSQSYWEGAFILQFAA